MLKVRENIPNKKGMLYNKTLRYIDKYKYLISLSMFVYLENLIRQKSLTAFRLAAIDITQNVRLMEYLSVLL